MDTIDPMRHDAAAQEINLRELLNALWQGRRLIALVCTLSTAAATAYAFLATPIYRAEAIVQVNDQDQGGLGSMAALASKFGGIADLAGITVGSDSSQDVALATLQSRSLVQKFIDDNKLLPELFPRRWDSGNNRWDLHFWQDQPTSWLAYDKPFTDEILNVSQDKKTQLVTISVDWKVPAQAQQWVMDLILRTNALLRAKAIERSEQNLKYLAAQMAQTSTVELQQSLYSLIEGEQKKLMLAQVSEDYALVVVDPAFVPEKPVYPKRPLLIILGFALGAVAGAVIVMSKKKFFGA